MKGRAMRRNQPSADPKPFVFRPWYHFVCEMNVSVSDSNWHAIDVVPLKDAVKAQLRLGDVPIDLRTRNISAWILNETFTGTLGLATSAVVGDKDANRYHVSTTGATSSFPITFQNVVEDRPAKNHWARAKLGWPGSQQKLAWRDTVQLENTVGSETNDVAVPVFYAYIDPQAGANNVTIRVTGWWRPTQTNATPTSLSLTPRSTAALTRQRVIIGGGNPETGVPAKVGTADYKDYLQTQKPTMKKMKSATPKKVSPVPSVVSSTSSRGKPTARSQAFKKWKDTQSEMTSISPSDSVSQVDFRDFKDQIMKLLTDFKREVSSAQAGEKAAKRETAIVQSQTIPVRAQRPNRREPVAVQRREAPPEIRKGCGSLTHPPDVWKTLKCPTGDHSHEDFLPLSVPCGNKCAWHAYCSETSQDVTYVGRFTQLCSVCEKK